MICKLTDQCSCPDLVHVLYIGMTFLAVNCRCELKTKMACGVGKQNFQLIAELKGNEHIANAVGVNTCFCLVSRGFSENSDYLTRKWFLCVSYGSTKLLLL